MLLLMMIESMGEKMEKPQLSSIAPRGTIRRFTAAGGSNTLLFWIFWEVLRISPALDLFSETGVWTVAWIMSCTISHFTHRYFTFDKRKDVRNTMLGAYTVYAIGGVLSTISYNAIYSMVDWEIRIIFILNVLIWGLFTWVSLRWFVFGYTDD